MINFILFIFLLILLFLLPIYKREDFTVFVPSYSPYRIYYPTRMLYPPGLPLQSFSSFYYPFSTQYFYPAINPFMVSPYYGSFF